MPSTSTDAADHLHQRLQAIAESLAMRKDALALLALGSVGRETARLDRWSDLDFFVLVRDGAKRRTIEQLDWLAAAHPIAWSFSNTFDGHKVLMADGVFCEFAVFERHELGAIPYAPGRFVWKRDEVGESLAWPQRALPLRASREWLVGEALSNLMIGLQRHARGERLAAMRMVQVCALDRLLELIDAPDAARDPFNVDRRVEQRLGADRRELLARLAPGYHGTVPAALLLLAQLQAHAEVPEAAASRIRELAALADHS